MGVPKFFRWMSERYPAISQLIAENRIPEFDCLYLDMNGIIHNCTHKDSDSPTFRMTEDKMFIAIFNYIEHLFGKIKPKKLFFMAIDGVAPRAKMNQQRARRFRTALDAEKAREKAISEGVEMPKEDAFDSNCITPGTEFMAKLTQQLKYFINKKVSEDLDWQGVEVVLSGHEVPGEGEHKIMEYIRQAKSQPGYDPNRRHCLYGLDADLIMLGLLSHDPHFSLLREEVTFGRQSQKKSKELEHQNFYLMHLCIVREYLELEFQELEEPGALSFPFDMERVIDDFILMAFFVGNDFLPNLPHLHINEGALALMFNVYKTVLPKTKGYINEGGVINMERLALLLEELSHVEYRHFESENADAAWFKGKRLEKEDVMERTKKRGTIVLSTEQREIFLKIKNFVAKHLDTKDTTPYDLPTSLKAVDRKFVQDLADSLHLQWKTVQTNDGDRHLRLSFPPKLPDENLEPDDEESEYDESRKAILRVLQKYENAKVVDISPEEAQNAMKKKYDEKFQSWKNQYYMTKFGWDRTNDEELTKLTENYVQGLQWVLYYYYRGVASWPWFYRYHYSPMISDVTKGLKADINFTLGQPFKPFQQLMGVLPDRSKKIVPVAYHDLMTSKESPIIDFYPRDFELDMNGKKMDWEAVVKIPFIEEDRLLKAMATKEQLLTEDEKARNSFGVSLKFTYSPDLDYIYPSSLPGIFPDLPHCRCIENIFELPTMEGLEVYVGLMDGVKLGASSLAGFPSLKVLPFYGKLDFAGVNVFQQDSRNESMIITLLDTESRTSAAYAKEKLGNAVHVGYPFLQEAKVIRVSDELFDYVLSESGPPVAVPHGPKEIENFKRRADRIENTYSKRLGMIIGQVESLVHVEMLKGLRKTDEGATVKEYAAIPGLESEYATQTIVDEVISEDPRFLEQDALPIEEEFPEGARAFYLGDYAYGRPLQVIAHVNGNKVKIMVARQRRPEPEFGREVVRNADKLTPYYPSYVVARQLSMPPLALSKITSAFKVSSSGLTLNLGLNLKFEAKKQKVLGYSRKPENGWEYSQKAIDLISQYMIKFPEFIAGIISNPSGDNWKDTDFYPADIAKQKVKEIGAWLKEIESKSFERVPLDAEQLDSDTVKLIEQAADANSPLTQDVENKKIAGVPRSALLKPSDAEQRLGNQRFSLGDRIVYVQDSGRVPIGLIGTVIGKTRTARAVLLDVVFDATYMSGTTLGDRCSPFRGSTVPATAVLNLTDKQVISYSTAGAAKRPQSSSQPLTARGYGIPNGPQLVPAHAPPPLRSSYRGAFGGGNTNGTPRGGRGGGMAPRGNGHVQNGAQVQQQLPIHSGTPRGRGGFGPRAQSNGSTNENARGNGGFVPRGRGRPAANRGGFTVTDMNDPTEGVIKNNPNFRPQPYTNVPPPPSLDARGSHRGRGRGRGGFRGRGVPRGGGAASQQQQ